MRSYKELTVRKTTEAFECDECHSVVIDQREHNNWHEDLELELMVPYGITKGAWANDPTDWY